MLTGKSEIESKESGFDSGADDYLTKPFNPRELAGKNKHHCSQPFTESVTNWTYQSWSRAKGTQTRTTVIIPPTSMLPAAARTENLLIAKLHAELQQA